MKGVRKRFSKELHDQNDASAKQVVMAYLGSGWMENSKRTGVDLIHEDLEKFAEVEVKHRWSGSSFPYKDVQLPERKGKWRDLDIEFFILNKEKTHAIVFHGSVLDDSMLREVPNKYVYSGEYFFAIPIEECEIVEL
jgi:hypothetical protein